jgi:cell division transport system permease protein
MVSILRRIRRNISAAPYINVATTGSISFSLVIIGIFVLLHINISDLIKGWQHNIRLVAYLGDGTPGDRIEIIQQGLAKLQGVESVRYVSKQEAFDQLRIQLKHRASLLEGLRTNPLPASFEIRLVDTLSNWEHVEPLTNLVKGFPEVDQVEYGKAWLRRFSGFIAFFKLTSFIVGALVLGTTVFICANTIKLTLYAKREELEIMRLVGATEAFVKTPFYIQNLIEGLIGGLIALGLLFLAYKFLVGRVHGLETTVSTFGVRFFSLSGVLGLLWTGMLMGWLGSYLSLRQFLGR